VLDALDLLAEERTGVSSGARIVRTSNKSSRLETADPGLVVSNVFENDIVLRIYLLSVLHL
jgi:hypothetical protein